MYGMLILKACLHHCKHYVIHSYLPSLLKSANNEHEPLDFNMFDPWDTSISGIAWALLGAHLSQYTKISSSQDSSWVSWIECRGCQLGKEEGVPSNLKSYMFIHGVPEGLELALCLESEPIPCQSHVANKTWKFFSPQRICLFLVLFCCWSLFFTHLKVSIGWRQSSYHLFYFLTSGTISISFFAKLSKTWHEAR